MGMRVVQQHYWHDWSLCGASSPSSSHLSEMFFIVTFTFYLQDEIMYMCLCLLLLPHVASQAANSA